MNFITTTIGIVEILMILVAIFFHKATQRNQSATSSPRSRNRADGKAKLGPEDASLGTVQYQLHDLDIATNYFSDDNKLGKGGFGVVYKGLIDGEIVAIKLLHGNSVKLLGDVAKEVSLLSSLNNSNLVKLLGYCSEAGKYILVYEYIPNGDLRGCLNDDKRRKSFNWEKRFKIIVGIARGLYYLHHTNENVVIHHDLKPENILLDEHCNPKIADFGLSKVFETTKTHKRTKKIAGTLGYMAPELYIQQHYSTRSDVYNYGLLVLEILTGYTIPRYARDNEETLSHVIWQQWKDKRPLEEIIDSSLQENCADQISRCYIIGLLCVQHDPKRRPSMEHVLQMLSTNISLPVPSFPGFFQGPYNTSKTSSNSTSAANTGKLSSLSNSTFNPSSGLDDRLSHDGRIFGNPNLRIFTFAELRSATKKFKPKTLVGEGSFGRVYKGWVDEKTLKPTRSGTGLVIAVKKWNPESLQGLKEWQSEVHFLGTLFHPNLVRLLGYCWEDKDILLVYEFMPRGNLENHLFRRGTYEPLSWDLRLKIAIGAARGLSFLHASERQVIYRDFKASNILLDSNYNAKLSDFGLAKLGPTGSNSHVSTRVMGTYGYAAPEYVATGHLYVKSDVYGFGVVLLEMLSGQRALDPNRASDQLSLVDWAKSFFSDKRRLTRVMDPRLEGRYPSKAALEAADLTLNCLAIEPKNRPSMKQVVEKLEQIVAMKESATKDLGRGKVT